MWKLRIGDKNHSSKRKGCTIRCYVRWFLAILGVLKRFDRQDHARSGGRKNTLSGWTG